MAIIYCTILFNDLKSWIVDEEVIEMEFDSLKEILIMEKIL